MTYDALKSQEVRSTFAHSTPSTTTYHSVDYPSTSSICYLQFYYLRCNTPKDIMSDINTNSLNALPNELLIQIASHLDVDAPSIAKFAHEPSTELTESDYKALKTCHGSAGAGEKSSSRCCSVLLECHSIEVHNGSL